jgi:hypothetical protein
MEARSLRTMAAESVLRSQQTLSCSRHSAASASEDTDSRARSAGTGGRASLVSVGYVDAPPPRHGLRRVPSRERSSSPCRKQPDERPPFVFRVVSFTFIDL